MLQFRFIVSAAVGSSGKFAASTLAAWKAFGIARLTVCWAGLVLAGWLLGWCWQSPGLAVYLNVEPKPQGRLASLGPAALRPGGREL